MFSQIVVCKLKLTAYQLYHKYLKNIESQDGVDADKVQASDKTQKSRAVLGRSVNGVVTDHIQVFMITTS